MVRSPTPVGTSLVAVSDEGVSGLVWQLEIPEVSLVALWDAFLLPWLQCLLYEVVTVSAGVWSRVDDWEESSKLTRGEDTAGVTQLLLG